MLRPFELQPGSIGAPLGCDILDQQGVLLVAGGTVLSSGQYERLGTRRLFIRTDAGSGGGGAMAPGGDRLSPPEAIVALRAGLERAAQAGPDPQAFPARLDGLVEALRTAVRADCDAAVGVVLLERGARPALRHSVNVAVIADLVAGRLAMTEDERDAAVAAALTMNLSMWELHDQLAARSAALAPDQQAAVRTHPERSVAWLRAAGIERPALLETVLQHHERVDGSGYPHGLGGPAIGMTAKVVATADLYCARIAGRHYRPPQSPATAMRELFATDRAGVETVVAVALLRALGTHPPGTLVRLANRETAVITRCRAGAAAAVVSVLSPLGVPLPDPVPRDPRYAAFAIRAPVILDAKAHRFDLPRLWGYGG